ncbi:hypothetical protein QL285_070827 [Trifolium repens]|jgi:hypothetical protein|nr:hypothetical protein QL285_070827 [Trifolium repens]
MSHFLLLFIIEMYVFPHDLDVEFSDYVRSTKFKSVLLCNQHLDSVPAAILTRGPPRITTQIAKGWKEFCNIEQFKSGDCIRFKFAGILSPNMIHVRKLEDDQPIHISS